MKNSDYVKINYVYSFYIIIGDADRSTEEKKWK